MRSPQIGDMVIAELGTEWVGQRGRYLRDEGDASGKKHHVIELDGGRVVRVSGVVHADPEKCCVRGPRTAPAAEQWHHILCPLGQGAPHGNVLAEWATRPYPTDGAA